LNELFANSALAMFEVIVNTKQIEPKIKRRVSLDGNDLQSLMFNWLNELLIFVNSENLALLFLSLMLKLMKKFKVGSNL
jgi:SHS2 domain-containing protein